MIGLSGMNAGDALIGVAGSNMANMNSAQFKAPRVNLTSGPGGGIAPGVQIASVSNDPSPGYIDETGQELSNTDPGREVVGLMRGAYLYTASLRVVQTADRMLGTLLDATSGSRNPR